MSEEIDLPDIWLVESANMEWYRLFFDNSVIGIGYEEGTNVWDRFNNRARKDDLVWLIPHGARNGAIGQILDKSAKKYPTHPIWRRKVDWLEIFSEKGEDGLEQIPVILRRYKKTPTFAQMRKPWIALVEIYKRAGIKYDYEFYDELQLIENFQEYLISTFPDEKKTGNETDMEEFIADYLENVKKFKVEFASERQKGYDLIVQKRKENFLVEVKSGVSFSPDQIRFLCEEADEKGYIPWLVVTDFLTDRRKRNILNLVPKPLVWDITDIYNDILQNFHRLPKWMKKYFKLGIISWGDD